MAFPVHDSYVDSETIFEKIPSHWSTVRLGYVSDVIDPQPDHRAPAIATEGGFPYIGIRDVNKDGSLCFETARQVIEKAVIKQENSFSIDPKDILFGKVGTLGQPKHIKPHGRFALSATLVLIKGKKNINRDFLKYALDSNVIYEQIENLSYGATRPALGIQQIRKLLLATPPVEEQKRIADFLDRKTSEIDQAIAQKQRLIELLQEQKAILINQAVTKGLNPNAPMHDSGIEWLSDIPEHWQVTRLKRLFLEIDDRSTDGSETLLSLRMYAGLVPHDDVSDKPIEDAALVGYKRVYPGQIVMNRMRAAIGLFGVATDFGIVSPDYAIFRPTKDLRVEYYLNLFKTESLKRVFFLESKGLGTGSSGFLRLYSDNFGMIKVPFPPLKEQIEICNHIQKIGNQFSKALEKVEQEINLLKELKSIFISQAVTGKIKV